MPSTMLAVGEPHAAIADRVVLRACARRSHRRAVASFDFRDITPGLAAVTAGVHRQRAADRARNAGQELGLGAVVHRREARELRARDAGLRVDQAVGDRQHAARRVHQHDRAAHASVAHQQVAAEPDRHQRLARRELSHERRQVVAVGRHVSDIGLAAAAPARVSRQRLVAAQLAAQAGELQGLGHHHVPAASKGETCPIDPAPIVSTTSPSRAMARIASGTSATSSTNTGSTWPRDTQRARQRASVGGDDRRLAGGIDLREEQRVDRRQHADEILEQVARARVAMRLEGEHQPSSGKASARRGERRRHLRRMMAVVVDQRERPPPCERDVAEALEAAPDTLEFGERAWRSPRRRRPPRVRRRSPPARCARCARPRD